MRDFQTEPFNRLAWERNYFDIPNCLFVIRYWWRSIRRINSCSLYQKSFVKQKKILSRIGAFSLPRHCKTRQLFRRLFARCQFRAGTRIRHCLKTFGCTGIEFRHSARHTHCSCIFPDECCVNTFVFIVPHCFGMLCLLFSVWKMIRYC